MPGPSANRSRRPRRSTHRSFSHVNDAQGISWVSVSTVHVRQFEEFKIVLDVPRSGTRPMSTSSGVERLPSPILLYATTQQNHCCVLPEPIGRRS